MWKYIVGIILGLFLFLFFLLLNLLFFLRKNKKINLNSEKLINKFFINYCKNTNNFFIPRSLFEYKKNFFEIDSLLFTKNSLFVIKFNNLEGKLFGKADSNTLLNNNSLVNNPILENDINIKKVLSVLGSSVPCISFIIVPNNLKNIEISNIPEHVVFCKEKDLKTNWNKMLDNLEYQISEKENNYIYYVLKKSLIKNKKIIKKVRKKWK